MALAALLAEGIEMDGYRTPPGTLERAMRDATGSYALGARMSTIPVSFSTLAAKDWRLFWADRRAAVLCFVVPVVLASAFGLIFTPPNCECRSARDAARPDRDGR